MVVVLAVEILKNQIRVSRIAALEGDMQIFTDAPRRNFVGCFASRGIKQLDIDIAIDFYGRRLGLPSSDLNSLDCGCSRIYLDYVCFVHWIAP